MEAGAVVGAGSVVPPGRRVPAGEHWAGNPVSKVGAADPALHAAALKAQSDAKDAHADEFLPVNTAFWSK